MIENRLTRLLDSEQKNLLTIYFTAGFPNLEDTLPILQALEEAGAHIVEIGMPFSDPIADGPTIQMSNQKAIENGMSIPKLLEQLQGFREHVKLPVLLMGYLNPVVQYGLEKFCREVAEIGIDGLILPDLPTEIYQNEIGPLMEASHLSSIFLITPETSEARIREKDAMSRGFIYAVSQSSTTGKTGAISESQEDYFRRIQGMHLQNPFQIGFGISDRASYLKACSFARGAIMGSAFIKHIQAGNDLARDVQDFVHNILTE